MNQPQFPNQNPQYPPNNPQPQTQPQPQEDDIGIVGVYHSYHGIYCPICWGIGGFLVVKRVNLL